MKIAWTRTFFLLPALWALIGALAPVVAEDEPPTAAATSGDKLILRAHDLSGEAETVADYTEIIKVGNDAFRLGVSDESTQYLKRVMSWAYNRRGELLAEQGHDTVALNDFEAAIANDPTRWRALHNRGISYAMMGRQQPALADFNRTVELNPNYANAYFNRGEVRYELGQFDAAIKDYTRAIQLNPNDAHAHNSRGHAYYRQNKYREAVLDFTVAIRLDSKNAGAYANRGDLYSELGFYERAANDYKEAVRLAPDYARAYLSAAWLMATCPDKKWRSPQGAIENTMKAGQLGAPKDHRYYDVLAAAHAASGDFSQAQKVLNQAIQIAPRGVAPQYRKRLALYGQFQPYRTTAKPVPPQIAEQSEQGVRQAGLEKVPQK
jgi:tetratricopeptide (TPR) repeat protein